MVCGNGGNSVKMEGRGRFSIYVFGDLGWSLEKWGATAKDGDYRENIDR